jgi:hypothetical protein
VLNARLTVTADEHVSVIATIRIENIGNTPALKVWAQTTLCFDFGFIDETIHELSRGVELTRRQIPGAIIFPKDSFDFQVRMWVRLPELPRAAVTIITGILTYSFGQDTGTTTFAFSLIHRVWGVHFVRAAQLGHGGEYMESDIVFERIDITGNDAT